MYIDNQIVKNTNKKVSFIKTIKLKLEKICQWRTLSLIIRTVLLSLFVGIESCQRHHDYTKQSQVWSVKQISWSIATALIQ